MAEGKKGAIGGGAEDRSLAVRAGPGPVCGRLELEPSRAAWGERERDQTTYKNCFGAGDKCFTGMDKGMFVYVAKNMSI